MSVGGLVRDLGLLGQGRSTGAVDIRMGGVEGRWGVVYGEGGGQD